MSQLLHWSQFLLRAQAGHSAVDLVSVLTSTLNQRNCQERIYIGTYIPESYVSEYFDDI